MKTTSGTEQSTGTVSVTRSTNGSSFGSAGIARRSRSWRVGCSGKSDAVCPSAPRPSRLRGAELAANPLHFAGWRLDPVEQVLARDPEVRELVLGRHAALVPPPERGRAPVRLALGCELIGAPGRCAAGEHDRTA